jgi:hypothetical protein
MHSLSIITAVGGIILQKYMNTKLKILNCNANIYILIKHMPEQNLSELCTVKSKRINKCIKRSKFYKSFLKKDDIVYYRFIKVTFQNFMATYCLLMMTPLKKKYVSWVCHELIELR